MKVFVHSQTFKNYPDISFLLNHLCSSGAYFASKWQCVINSSYLFSMAAILNSPKGAWFCRIVIRVWTWVPSLAPPVGLNRVQTKCSSISGSVSNMAEMCRAWKQNEKIKLLGYHSFRNKHVENLLNILTTFVLKHDFYLHLILLMTPIASSYFLEDFQPCDLLP